MLRLLERWSTQSELTTPPATSWSSSPAPDITGGPISSPIGSPPRSPRPRWPPATTWCAPKPPGSGCRSPTLALHQAHRSWQAAHGRDAPRRRPTGRDHTVKDPDPGLAFPCGEIYLRTSRFGSHSRRSGRRPRTANTSNSSTAQAGSSATPGKPRSPDAPARATSPSPGVWRATVTSARPCTNRRFAALPKAAGRASSTTTKSPPGKATTPHCAPSATAGWRSSGTASKGVLYNDAVHVANRTAPSDAPPLEVVDRDVSPHSLAALGRALRASAVTLVRSRARSPHSLAAARSRARHCGSEVRSRSSSRAGPAGGARPSGRCRSSGGRGFTVQPVIAAADRHVSRGCPADRRRGPDARRAAVGGRRPARAHLSWLSHALQRAAPGCSGVHRRFCGPSGRALQPVLQRVRRRQQVGRPPHAGPAADPVDRARTPTPRPPPCPPRRAPAPTRWPPPPRARPRSAPTRGGARRASARSVNVASAAARAARRGPPRRRAPWRPIRRSSAAASPTGTVSRRPLAGSAAATQTRWVPSRR